jgi:hypothetical protein
MLHSGAMTPDSSRQWYLYYQEKESGPLAEADLIAKIASGEVGMDAYVFTEGMTDWALVSDTTVLRSAPKGASLAVVADDGGAELLSGMRFDESASAKTDRTVKVDSASLQQMNPDELFLGAAEAAPQAAAPSVTAASNAADASERDPQEEEAKPSDSKKTSKSKGSLFGFLKSKKTSSPSAEKAPKPKARISPLAAVLLVLVLLLAGAYSFTQMGGKIPFVSDAIQLVLGPTATELQQEASGEGSPAPVGEAPLVETPPAEAPASEIPSGNPTPTEFSWSELIEFRKVEDAAGPPFRMASRFLGGDRPVLVGVLSPLIPAAELKVAVFPMNERSLMAVPRVWYFRASVVDGFFSVGPLLNGADPLKAGRYYVYVQFEDKFLGETEFEVGSWPAPAELGLLQDALQKERTALSDQERAALETKSKELSAAAEQLKAAGAKVTGARALAQFNKATQPWREKLSAAISEQGQLMRGPMFFPKAQAAAMDWMTELQSLHAAIELQARRGPQALRAARKKGLGQLWSDATKRQQTLLGEMQALAMQKEPLALMIDTESVKTTLKRL